MRIKLKSIIIIIMVIFSYSLIDWDINLRAKNLDNEMNSTSTSRSDKHPRGGNFDWGEIEVISEPIVGQNINVGDSRVPRVAVEGNKIYVVWDDNTDYNSAGTDPDIFYRYYDGNKWSDIQVISEPVPGQNFNNRNSLIPYIAVENGKIYVVWQDNQKIFYRCNLTGNSWEDIQVISEPSGMSPHVAVENNKIYVVWQDDNNMNGCGTDGDIFYRCNLTGNSWEDIQVVSEPVLGHDFNIEFSSNPEIAVENGNVYVVWVDDNNSTDINRDYDIFFRYNNGNSWSEIEVISNPDKGQNFAQNTNCVPSIAVENNKIYTVWYSNNTPNENCEIFYRCNLTGTYWESIQIISDPVPNSNFNVNFSNIPVIAVENGKIFVVWSDANRTNGYVTDSGIFYRCNVTGVNWEDIQVISEPVEGGDINYCQYYFPYIAVNRGKSYIVWEGFCNINGVDTDSDIFYRYIFLPFILNSSITPFLGNTSTVFNFTITYTHLLNTAPMEVTVYIDNKKYSMFEVNPADINYLDGKDYFFNIKNLDIGTHTYQFYASDGKFTYTTALIKNPWVYNTPPKITTENNLTAFEDTYYEVNYEYEDIDVENVGQVGTWEFSTDAEWLTFDITTAILNGTPTNDDVGEYWVNIIINDTMDIDYTNFTLTVFDINDNPIITTANVEITYEDAVYLIDYNATDVDSPIENQIWSLETNASSWLDIDSDTGVISGTPTNDEVGSYWVNVSVIDGEGGFDFTNFILIVLNVNDPPLIVTEDITTAIVNELYGVDYNATDIDSPLSKQRWFLNTNASNWLTIDSTTGVLGGTPAITDLGWYVLNVSVDDGDGGLDRHEFILTVIKSPEIRNKPPVITTIDVVSTTAGKLYQVDYEATDDRTPIDLLIWILETNASWLTIETNTGVLSGTPTENDVGTYWVNISVTDGENGWDYHNFTITVESIEDGISKEEVSKKESSWIWLILIVIIIVIIITLVVFVFIYKKREAGKIPTVKASVIKGASSPPPQLIASEKLPTPKVQLQPAITAPSLKVPVPKIIQSTQRAEQSIPRVEDSEE